MKRLLLLLCAGLLLPLSVRATGRTGITCPDIVRDPDEACISSVKVDTLWRTITIEGSNFTVGGATPMVKLGKDWLVVTQFTDKIILAALNDVDEGQHPLAVYVGGDRSNTVTVKVGELAGPQGPKGDKGDKGDPGLDGKSVTATAFSIADSRCNFQGGYEVVQYDPATGVTTSLGDVCNGAKGDQGLQGIQGLQGGMGPKGDKGDTGPKGDAAGVPVPPHTLKIGTWTDTSSSPPLVTDVNGFEVSAAIPACSGSGERCGGAIIWSDLIIYKPTVGTMPTVLATKQLLDTTPEKGTATLELLTPAGGKFQFDYVQMTGVFNDGSGIEKISVSYGLDNLNPGDLHPQFAVNIAEPPLSEDPSAFGNVQGQEIFGTDDLIPVHGFSWGATSSAKTAPSRGYVKPLDVSITRYVGRGSKTLFNYFMTNKHLGDFTIRIYSPGTVAPWGKGAGMAEPLTMYKFKDLVVLNVKYFGAGATDTLINETITFDYASVEISSGPTKVTIDGGNIIR